MERFVFCIGCKKEVENPALPCPGCGTTRDMVEQSRPQKIQEQRSIRNHAS